MKEKIFPAVFLMLVLLIGFPSSVSNFSVFADNDKEDERKNDKKDDKKELKEYEKQKERAEEAREKAEEQKENLKEKYKQEIEKLEEKTKQEQEKIKKQLEKEFEKSDKKEKDEKEFEKAKKLEEKVKEKIEKELEKLKEKAQRLEEDDNDDNTKTFRTSVDVQLSSITETGVTLCHIPPGNPSNAHTITVGLPAAKAHMAAHEDTMGPCGSDENIDLILEEHKVKLAEKLAKLEEKRAELQQKFIEKAQKLVDKFEEKQTKRAEKLLEKINSGEYFDELIEDKETLREFVLSFGSLTAEPIGKLSETLEFSGTITLVTSSSTDTRGTMKFKVTDCEIGNVDVSYSCKFGKARTISHGAGGEKNGLVIIATLDDDNRGYPTGLKAFVTADREINSLEEGHDTVLITMHSPQSTIVHQWFLGGEGSLTVTSIVSDDDT